MKAKDTKRINKALSNLNDFKSRYHLSTNQEQLLTDTIKLLTKTVTPKAKPSLTGSDAVIKHFKTSRAAIECNVSDHSEDYAVSDSHCTRSIIAYHEDLPYPFRDSEGISWKFVVAAPKPSTENLFA